MAGAPGIEPGITGSKPVALPLGYAPLCVCSGCSSERTLFHKASLFRMQILLAFTRKKSLITYLPEECNGEKTLRLCAAEFIESFFEEKPVGYDNGA